MLLLVSFLGLLRIGEALRIRAGDVIFYGAEAVIHLPRTKTGRDQPVRVSESGVVAALRCLIALLQPEDFLVQASYILRVRLRTALRIIGVDPTRYVWHSLRHGGATWYYLGGEALDNVAHRGRWRSLQTARRYIQMGVALMGSTRLSALMRDRARRAEKNWPWRIRVRCA